MTPVSEKRSQILAIFLMISVALMVASMDIYLPAMPIMRDQFHTSEFWMQMSIMVSPFASAFVGILFGRFSDVYGRLPLLFTAFGFFLLGGLGCCFSNSIETFFISRIIQSIGSGGISILGVVVIADMFHGVKYARYMAIYGSLFPVVFAIAPIVGAQLTEIFGWRACFIFVFTGMFIITGILKVMLHETLKKEQITLTQKQGGFAEFFSKAKMLLSNREFVLMAFGHALPVTIGGLFSCNAAFIFIDSFGYTPTAYSFSQAIPVGLNFLGVLIYRANIAKLGMKGALQIGSVGLCLFIVFSLSLLLGILPNNPIMILSIFCLSNFAMPFIIATCATRAFETFPQDRGLSVSVVALLRNFSLSAIVSTTGIFFNGTIFPVFLSMSLVCCLVLSIITLALQRPLAFAKE